MDPVTGETGKVQEGSPQIPGQTSPDGAGSTSQPAKTFTEAEAKAMVDKARSDALAEAGRQRKAIEDENTSLKTRVANFDTNIAEIQADRAKLRTELEEMAKDDPDKTRMLQKMKGLEEAEKALKADRDKLQAEKLEHAELVRTAAETRIETTVNKIVTEYEGGDAVKLLTAVKKFGISSPEQIRDFADTLWSKKAAPPAPVTSAPDSGENNGGATVITPEMASKMTMDEYANHPSVKKRYGGK